MKEVLSYFKQFKGSDERKEVSYEEALDTLLTTYKDNDMTRDWLSVVNTIPCRFSTITVEQPTEWGNLVLIAGLQCVVPDGVEYDEDGMRI